MNFNDATLSQMQSDWTATPSSLFDGKYNATVAVSGSNIKVDLDVAESSVGFTEITTVYQDMLSVSAKINLTSGVTGIDFDESSMNGSQFYKLSGDPGIEAYKSPNAYEEADFVDTYVGRIYGTKYGWTQINSLNWATLVNTSVWEGYPLVPVAFASNLRIHKPGQLSIPPDGELTVSGNTDIKPDNGLIIESDASGTGSFITHSTSGSAVVQRYMTTDAWHIVAAPVAGQSISGFLGANNNVATDVDYEISDPNAIRGMMDYNPALNQWNSYFTNSTLGTLSTGKGFCIRTNENSAVTFTGVLLAGTQIISGLSPEYWNCVGNPYTSAVGINDLSSSASNFLGENVSALDPSYGAIYVWDNTDDSNGLYGKYTIISNTPTDAAFDVQQGQAFMVKMKAGISSLVFEPGMQIHEPSLTLKSTKEMWPTIKLEALANSQKASTIIAFNGGMTKGLDPTYDAGLFKSGADLNIYSRLVDDNGVSFAIQALPADQYNSLVVPIGIDCKSGGEVTFSSQQVNLPSSCQIILEDKYNQTFTDLATSVYKTVVPANTDISDRFALHTSYLTTGLNYSSLEDQMSAWAIRNIEIKLRGKVNSRTIASLFDVQGRMILTKNLEAGSFNTISTPNLKTGIYFLVVQDDNTVHEFKVPVKQ